MNRISLLVLVTLSVAFSYSVNEFSANVIISNSPSVSGKLSGKLYYSVSGQRIRIDYTVGPTEYYDFGDNLRYLVCGQDCDAETITYDMPVYGTASGDSSAGTITSGGRTCTGYKHSASPTGGAKTVYVSGNDVCRVVYVDGTTYDFTGNGALPSGWYKPLATCPKPKCSKRIDFQLIFDESGSISSSDFTVEKNFGKSIADSYTFGVDNVAMGLILFDYDARIVQSITTSKQSFMNSINGAKQGKGNTCISCGLNTARSNLLAHYRKVPGTNTPVSRVFILLTDGYQNEGQSDLSPAVQADEAAGIITFCIGVGSGFNRNQLDQIATTVSGVQTVLTAKDFAALAGILDQLTFATCVNLPGNPCGGGCAGFCSCNKKCICPDICDDNNACTVDGCSTSKGGSGCTHTALTCDDHNACTVNKCNPSKGCDYSTPVNCDDNNLCTTDLCNPAVGCTHPARVCDDGDPCTQNLCHASSGCDFTQSAPCDLCKGKFCPSSNCKIGYCELSTGICKTKDLDCDDGSVCTKDACDPRTGQCTYSVIPCDDGDACTIDSCDAVKGCQYTPVNVTEYCDDQTLCTTDTCDKAKGCVHTPITCDDGDPCTTNECSSLTGCYYQQLDCTKTSEFVGRNIGDCHTVTCNSTASTPCQLLLLPNMTEDRCQVCNGDGSSCAQLDSDATAGIGGGLIAVIVLACVAVCAVLAAFGGKKGYDVWLSHRANMQGANTNPLYNSEGLSGTNPMYAQ